MPRRAVSALTRFWADDRGLSVFLALLLVVAFVLPPLLPPGREEGLAADLVYGLLLISGVLALGWRSVTRWALLLVAAVTLAVDLGSRVRPVAEPWALGTRLLSLAIFVVVVLVQTLRSGPITFHRIQGGTAAYLLLGVIWAHAYALLAALSPGAFAGAIGAAEGPRAWLYFSFVTLTTVGYGDVQPVHPIARSLATLEAVVGPLYLAILIARLVSLTAVGDAGAGGGGPAAAGGRANGGPT